MVANIPGLFLAHGMASVATPWDPFFSSLRLPCRWRARRILWRARWGSSRGPSFGWSSVFSFRSEGPWWGQLSRPAGSGEGLLAHEHDRYGEGFCFLGVE